MTQIRFQMSASVNGHRIFHRYSFEKLVKISGGTSHRTVEGTNLVNDLGA